MSTASSRKIHVPLTDTGIHYAVEGAGDAVVFLHGITLDGRMWERQVAALREGHRCIAVDRRGHGQSQSLIAGYDPLIDLEGVLTHSGTTSCCLVGHSLGGWDAIRFAGRRPEAVASLVLVDAYYPFPPMRWQPPVGVARTQGADSGRAAWLADPLFASVREPSVRARLAEIVGGNDLGIWVGDVPSADAEVSPVELAAAVRVPTLVVAGALDLPGFIDVANWLAAHLSGVGARPAVVVEDAGHMLPMEAPQAFNQILTDFLGEYPATTT